MLWIHSNQKPFPRPVEKGKKRSGVVKFLVDILETLIWAVVLFVLINLVSARVRVDGASMLPTLTNGELVIVNKLAYRLGEPARGDIIVFYFPGRSQPGVHQAGDWPAWRPGEHS